MGEENAIAIPSVLTFSGSDPSGGAGLQADIEAIGSLGCHACCAITALTVQNTEGVKAVVPVDPLLLIEQARAVLEDIPVGAIKIGLAGDVATISAIHSILADWPQIPVVLDPVLTSGGGTPLIEDAARDALLSLLVPAATVITPNSNEVRALAAESDSLATAAGELIDYGCEYVLVTGSHRDTPTVINDLYSRHGLVNSFEWPRLPGEYHGSGCTLASAITALLAHGSTATNAIESAQRYTWDSLKHGFSPGRGQLLPDRLFWARGKTRE